MRSMGPKKNHRGKCLPSLVPSCVPKECPPHPSRPPQRSWAPAQPRSWPQRNRLRLFHLAGTPCRLEEALRAFQWHHSGYEFCSAVNHLPIKTVTIHAVPGTPDWLSTLAVRRLRMTTKLRRVFLEAALFLQHHFPYMLFRREFVLFIRELAWIHARYALIERLAQFEKFFELNASEYTMSRSKSAINLR